MRSPAPRARTGPRHGRQARAGPGTARWIRAPASSSGFSTAKARVKRMVVLFFRSPQGRAAGRPRIAVEQFAHAHGRSTGRRDGVRSAPRQRLGMTQISRGAFTSDDAEIAYLDAGAAAGAPIVLVHGFASTKETNWVTPGWVDTLTRAGRRAIALDNRGHGESTKLYDPARYHTAVMAEDVRALMDHLGLDRADLIN